MKPSVAIVLGFYDGYHTIADQVNSIFSQVGVEISLFIFDDNPNSPLLDKRQFGLDADDETRIYIHKRKLNLGFAQNFMQGLAEISQEYDYYAFSDQDDIWDVDKIKIAINQIVNFSDVPALYGSATRIVKNNIYERNSRSFISKPSFRHALHQNMFGGNTMLFNCSAKKLITQNLNNIDIPSHDWWVYLIISGSGGVVVYDPEPHMDYIQHSQNLVGEANSLVAKLKRIKFFLDGRFRGWCNANESALLASFSALTDENKKLVVAWSGARKKTGFFGMYVYFKNKFRREGFFETIILYLGVFFGLV